MKTAEYLSRVDKDTSINRNQSYLPEEDVMSSVAKGKYSGDFHQNPLWKKLPPNTICLKFGVYDFNLVFPWLSSECAGWFSLLLLFLHPPPFPPPPLLLFVASEAKPIIIRGEMRFCSWNRLRVHCVSPFINRIIWENSFFDVSFKIYMENIQ